jgi:hypothetical protein
MAVGDEYLSEAAKYGALTECETDPGKRDEFANLSRAYLRLALRAKGYTSTCFTSRRRPSSTIRINALKKRVVWSEPKTKRPQAKR